MLIIQIVIIYEHINDNLLYLKSFYEMYEIFYGFEIIILDIK
jgi:hypothetical protein